MKKGDVVYTNYLEHECGFKEDANHDEWHGNGCENHKEYRKSDFSWPV